MIKVLGGFNIKIFRLLGFTDLLPIVQTGLKATLYIYIYIRPIVWLLSLLTLFSLSGRFLTKSHYISHRLYGGSLLKDNFKKAIKNELLTEILSLNTNRINTSCSKYSTVFFTLCISPYHNRTLFPNNPRM